MRPRPVVVFPRHRKLYVRGEGDACHCWALELSGRRSIEAEASAARRRRAARVPERANKATSQLIDQYEEEVVGGGFSVPVY